MNFVAVEIFLVGKTKPVSVQSVSFSKLIKLWKRLLLQRQTNRSISNIPETVFLLLTAEGLFIITSLFHFVQCFFLMESSSLTSIKQPKKLESAMNSLQPAELNMRWSRHYDYNIICEASDYWETWLWHIKGSYGILIRLTD